MSNWPMFIRGVAQQTSEKADKNAADAMVHGLIGKSPYNCYFSSRRQVDKQENMPAQWV